MTLDLPQLRLAALGWGPEQGDPVLALHGWMDNAASYAPLAGHLNDYGLHVVAPDLSGHGRSEHRPGTSVYHFSDFVAEVLAVADALGWRRFSVMGHSLGAGIVAFLAASVPERVQRVVLLDGLGPLSGRACDEPLRMRKFLLQSRRDWGQRHLLYPSFEAAVRARRRRWALSRTAAEILVRRGVHSVAGGWRWSNDLRAARRSPSYFSEEQVLAFLQRIKTRALLVKPDGGVLLRDERTAEREHAIRGLRVEAVPGGHYVHMDAPALISRLVGPFLLSSQE